eukprot:TRINITY_DN22820_c0_g1_i1.p1 TRINITY_DN22820_c0_g1~~TRINITY_DN22820_c0_g1_i1.p1  ORF type:complete len:133 (-),score=17.76 TRINITY_DN22820_c0_g1_i1:8-406(-)
MMVLIELVKDSNTQIKVTCVIFLLSLYYLLVIYLKPNKFPSHNRLEATSFLIIISTLGLGYLSTTDEASHTTNIVLTVLMVLINTIFFIYAFLGFVKGVIIDTIMKLSLIHISEPTRQAEISYAVFCLKKKK